MSVTSRLRSLWRNLLHRNRVERELEDELRGMFALLVDEKRRAGLRAEDAHRAAALELGRVAAIKDEIRDARAGAFVDTFLRDIRYAWRGMRRDPRFTIVVVFSLAIGIGATTAVFTVFNVTLLQPLSGPEPHRLVLLSAERRGDGYVIFNPVYESLRDEQRTLSGMSAVSDLPYLKVRFEGEALPTYTRGSLVSGSYFSVLGVAPVIGRMIVAQDDEAIGTAGVSECAAVVSHDLWTRRLGANPSVLGRHVDVGNVACAVVGVMPEAFDGHQMGYRPDVWVPLRALTDRKELASRTMAFFGGVIGRLRPGVEPFQAEAELNTLFQRIAVANATAAGETPPSPGEFRLRVLPGAQGLDRIRRQFSEPLWIVMGIAAVVLLIATVNVSTLLVARGRARVRELETRAALGASRSQLIIQLAIEGAVLTCTGGLLGVFVAWLISPTLAGFVSIRFPPVALEARPDLRVLAVAVGSTAFAAIVIGLLPAIPLTRRLLQSEHAGSRTVLRGKTPVEKALVVAQFALSLLLVTAAGLLLRTMVRISAIDPGFVPERVVIAEVREERPVPPSGPIDPATRKAQRLVSYRMLEDSLQGIPGVRSVALSWLGLFGGADLRDYVIDAGRPSERLHARFDYVSSAYFDTVGMRIVSGRGFTPDDREDTPRVAVVNEALARSPFGRGDVIGRQVTLDMSDVPDAPVTVVGVVRDSKFNDLREASVRPMVWVPLRQAPQAITSIAVRAEPGYEHAIARLLRQRVTSADPAHMVRRVVTLTDRLNQTLSRERLLLGLAIGFGIVAILLASVGLYGTLAHAVARRTREIGVRVAFGAEPGKMIAMVLREAMILTAIGLAIGLPLAIGVGNALRAFLFGVPPGDAVTLAASCMVLTIVALLAAYVPARRASRIDPGAALREA
jgi:predicted permease